MLRSRLAQAMRRGAPPEVRFTQTRPRGPVTQIVTPFSLQASVDAPTKVDFVFVTDAAGKHKVAVQQVP